MDWKIELDGVRALLKGFMWIAIVAGGLAIAGSAWDAADQAGFISHSGNAQVKYPHHGWEIGEYVTCAATTSSNAEPILNCEDEYLEAGTNREMGVTFWGRVEDKPKIFKCQRGSDSITCHLTDAPPIPSPSK
jgi:hypothetical protein